MLKEITPCYACNGNKVSTNGRKCGMCYGTGLDVPPCFDCRGKANCAVKDPHDVLYVEYKAVNEGHPIYREYPLNEKGLKQFKTDGEPQVKERRTKPEPKAHGSTGKVIVGKRKRMKTLVPGLEVLTAEIRLSDMGCTKFKYYVNKGSTLDDISRYMASGDKRFANPLGDGSGYS